MKIRSSRSHDIANFKKHGNLKYLLVFPHLLATLEKEPQPDYDLQNPFRNILFYLQNKSETIKVPQLVSLCFEQIFLLLTTIIRMRTTIKNPERNKSALNKLIRSNFKALTKSGPYISW
jgi:hypothetical protein